MMPQPSKSDRSSQSGGPRGKEPAGAPAYSSRLPSQRPAVVGLLLSLFVAALDSTIVASAMPAIATGLAGAELYAWPLTSYLLTCTVGTLACGALVACLGSRRVFLSGIVLFAVASVLCALAPSVGVLAIWRALQGFGGGLLEAEVFIAGIALFPPRERGAYLGAASAMYGLASITGPLVGGLIVGALSWRWVFLVNVPMCVAACVLAVRCLPGRGGAGAPGCGAASQVDVLGLAAASGCAVALTLAFGLAGSAFELGSAAFLGLVLLAGVLAVVLARVEGRAQSPAVPLGLLRTPSVLAGFAEGCAVQFALMTAVTIVPRLGRYALGLGTSEAGLLLVPMTLALVAGSNAAGAIFRATGRLRAISMAALTTVAVSSRAAAMLLGSEGGPGVGSLCGVLAVLGLGVGLGMPVANLAAQLGAAARDRGRATSLAMCFRGLGGTVATAVVGMLVVSAGAGSGVPTGASVNASAGAVGGLGEVGVAGAMSAGPAVGDLGAACLSGAAGMAFLVVVAVALAGVVASRALPRRVGRAG